MKKRAARANYLKKSAALFAIIAGGVAFCCSKKGAESSSDPDMVRIEEISLKDQGPESLQKQEPVIPEEEPKSAVSEKTGIWVYVCGAVRFPGVYFLAEDARVFEAVDMAGGLLETARKEAVNLAGSMTDGERIFIPDESDRVPEGINQSPSDPVSAAAGRSDFNSRVNINLADEKELMTLPGIGEAKAREIISYRQQHPFENIEEIMNVPGIKDSSFQKIRDLITV